MSTNQKTWYNFNFGVSLQNLRQTTLDSIDMQDHVLSDTDHCITVDEMAQDYNVTPDDSRYYWLYFDWPTEDGSEGTRRMVGYVENDILRTLRGHFECGAQKVHDIEMIDV